MWGPATGARNATAEAVQQQALVNLYKSMGGGWVVEADGKVAKSQ